MSDEVLTGVVGSAAHPLSPPSVVDPGCGESSETQPVQMISTRGG